EAAAKKIERAFKSAADSSTTGLNTLRSSVAGLTGAFGALAGLGIGALLKQVGETALQSAIKIDKSRQAIAALTGSGHAANRKLAELRKLAETSPGVTTTFAVQLFQQLKAVGSIADQTIEKVTKSLGKLNAVFSIEDPTGFARNLVQIFTQSFERADI